jgi:hypothetical protein
MEPFNLSTLPFEPVIEHLPFDDAKVVVEDSSSYSFPDATAKFTEFDTGDCMLSYYTLQELHDGPQRAQLYLDHFSSGLLITPSPLIEVLNDVQTQLNPHTRGFILSRYFIWCNPEQNLLCFLPKYETIIDNCMLNETLHRSLVTSLIKEPITINTYCLWVPQCKPSIKVFQQGVDFDILSDVQSYLSILNQSFIQHVKHSNVWLNNLPSKLQIIKE